MKSLSPYFSFYFGRRANTTHAMSEPYLEMVDPSGSGAQLFLSSRKVRWRVRWHWANHGGLTYIALYEGDLPSAGALERTSKLDGA